MIYPPFLSGFFPSDIRVRPDGKSASGSRFSIGKPRNGLRQAKTAGHAVIGAQWEKPHLGSRKAHKGREAEPSTRGVPSPGISLTWLTRALRLKEGGVSMSIYKRYLFTLLAGLATVVLVGCGQEKPAERAGEKADQAVERSEEKIEQPGDKVKEDAK
jgi:hypothetical protein